MRISLSTHRSQPWRIHEIAPDFVVEDVWALPVSGGPDDFPLLLEVAAALDFPDSAPLPVRVVWKARDELGRWFGLGRISVPTDESTGSLPIPGTSETTLAERLPDDLRGTAVVDVASGSPLRPLYQTENEYAEEMSNRTVHSVMHLGWVEQDDGSYRGQMAVLVQASWSAGCRLHGAHQAVPLRARLPRPDASGRTSMATPARPRGPRDSLSASGSENYRIYGGGRASGPLAVGRYALSGWRTAPTLSLDG